MSLRKKSADDLLGMAAAATGSEPFVLSQGLSFTSGSILQSSSAPPHTQLQSSAADRRSPSPAAAVAPHTSSVKAHHPTGVVADQPNPIVATDRAPHDGHTIEVRIDRVWRSATYSCRSNAHRFKQIQCNAVAAAANAPTTSLLTASTDLPEPANSANTAGSSTADVGDTSAGVTTALEVVQLAPAAAPVVVTVSPAAAAKAGGGKVSDRAKKKAWYSVLYPSYKSRSEDFKKLFKGVPDDERLVVGEWGSTNKKHTQQQVLALSATWRCRLAYREPA